MRSLGSRIVVTGSLSSRSKAGSHLDGSHPGPVLTLWAVLAVVPLAAALAALVLLLA